MSLPLSTDTPNTWCPGCSNFCILAAFRQVLEKLVAEESLALHNVVIASGIGCHGKITDYLALNSFTALHGRLVPVMSGIKCANPALTVIGFSGDGDAYSEGLEHLLHAARRNSDITLFVHNNEVFALTAGQATAASPKGFKNKASPGGSPEAPINAPCTMLGAGASFVARSYASDIALTATIMARAIRHRGFSFVEILQPCITFSDTRRERAEKIYRLDQSALCDVLSSAIERAEGADGRVPLGIFYDIEKPTFEDDLGLVTQASPQLKSRPRPRRAEARR
ncbi:MAG: Pyruvate ferredoxin/flavodoxin oxidoreductase, beta subunit [Parcubacteria group bacterium GW2011_GWB1_53_43]|nr:MAG: Pyruvate ferredoxin/flavodoxin oxidoreductase, beta subunit [Parcubacteria group bacterium GW2011_GWB1_53_43]